MAKKIPTADPKAETLKRIKRTEAYAEKVRTLFAGTVNEILALNKSLPKLDEGVMFSFDGENMKKQKEVEVLLRRLHSVTTMAIKQGIVLEWEQANNECDKLVSSAFGKQVLSSPEFKGWVQRNESARDAFINRSEKGMNLSDRIWRDVKQLREEMEVAMTVAMGEGDSAASVSKKVRKYLNDPDLMFRRFRYKKGEKEVKDESGKVIGTETVYGRKWKKRIKDEKTGKYKWIDYDKSDYVPIGAGKNSRGVYKSSAKNAMRVARTETNIAYRRADNERWQQMDFVLGQRVQLSRNHPKKDVCDKLAGEYPKDFVFDGWHPQCFCYVTPILIDEDEMAKVTEAFLKGEKYVPRGKKITEYPQNFKDWVKDNADNIAASRDRGTEPYFIRNNATAIDEILNPKPKELTTLEKAQIRHDARTPEQIEIIKQKAAERQKKHTLMKKTAGNVLKVAEDYGEVDYSKLKQYIADGNLNAMQSEAKVVAKQVAEMKKQETALSSIVPDVHQWHKQFTIMELQSVYSAVETKLQQWSALSLEEQSKKLKFEAYDFLGGNMKGVQNKYATWKVSQAAYIKKYETVLYEIDYQQAGKDIQVIKNWSLAHPKSAKVASLLVDAEIEYAAKGDIVILKSKIKLASDEKAKREAEQARRDAKKAKKNNGVIFDADAYTQKRKDNALWAKDTGEADVKLRDNCGNIWRNATNKEKDGIYGYTEEYHNINESLRGLTYIGSPTKTQRGLNRIPHIESIINKSSYDFDMWVQRGDDMVALKKFGLANYNSCSDADVNNLVGKEGVEGAFWSAGVAKGKGFGGQVIFNIYMPKGTKAMYCEPFSAFGYGDGKNWDGLSKQSYFGYESEILLQRGTKFRVTKVDKSNGTWYIDLDVIEQNPVPFPYIGGYPFK